MTVITRNEREFDIRTALRIHGLWLSGGMTMLGLQFLRPETSFNIMIYAEMRRWASEDLWGMAMVLVGLPRFILIIIGIWKQNGNEVVPPVAIVFLTLGSSLIWAAMAVLFFKVNPLGWSCIGTFILFGLDCSTCVIVAKAAGSQWNRGASGGTLPR